MNNILQEPIEGLQYFDKKLMMDLLTTYREVSGRCYFLDPVICSDLRKDGNRKSGGKEKDKLSGLLQNESSPQNYDMNFLS